MTDTTPTVTRPGFWDRGGFWKAVLLGLAYGVINVAVGSLVGYFLIDYIDADNILSDPLSILLGTGAAILIGGLAFAILAHRLGWWGQFLRQPASLSRSWWMWIPFVAILAFNVLRFTTADYVKFSAGSIIAILLLGLAIGFAEELVTRGFAVNLLRRSGYREVWVAVLSSLVFSAMHLANAFSMDFLTVSITLVYTFFFGIGMYFTLRAGRSIVWPMILHATTDPSGMLLQGGIDTATDAAATGGLAQLAGLANYAAILTGLVLVWCIRGRVDRLKEFGLGEPESDRPAMEAAA